LFGGLLKAEKIMAKMGYKEGDGLGRNKQGMSIALQVEKTGKRSGRIIHEKDVVEPTSPTTPSPALLPPVLPPVVSNVITKEPTASPQVGIPNEVMKNMSKVILLKNMVGPGDVDDDLEGETKEECAKYGEVNKCIIFEMPDKPAEEAVRIFIEFKTLPSAIKALTDLNGRFFGGRTVKAIFYNLDKFKRLELADES
jgi:splicing factor 45